MNNRIICIVLVMTMDFSQGKTEWSSWSRWSRCTVTCGRGTRFRRRQCDSGTSSSSGGQTCKGPSEMYSPCQLLACPEIKIPVCNCGCVLKGKKGKIVSNISSKMSKTCEWLINVTEGLKIELKINKLILESGFLRIMSKQKDMGTIVKPGDRLNLPLVMKSDSNKMTVQLMPYQVLPNQQNKEMVLEAEYKEIGKPTKQKKSESKSKTKSPNIPAIAGITTCVAIIGIACIILAIRRCTGKDKESESEEEHLPCTADEGSVNTQMHAQTPMREDRISHGRPMTPPLGQSQRSSSIGKLNGIRPELRSGRDSAYESEVHKMSHEDAFSDDNFMKYYRAQPEYFIKVANIIDPKVRHMLEQKALRYNQNPQQHIPSGSPLHHAQLYGQLHMAEGSVHNGQLQTQSRIGESPIHDGQLRVQIHDGNRR